MLMVATLYLFQVSHYIYSEINTFVIATLLDMSTCAQCVSPLSVASRISTREINVNQTYPTGLSVSKASKTYSKFY